MYAYVCFVVTVIIENVALLFYVFYVLKTLTILFHGTGRAEGRTSTSAVETGRWYLVLVSTRDQQHQITVAAQYILF